MYRHMRKYCKIATSDEGMDKLMEHTLARQLAEQRQETAQVKARLDHLTSLLERQLSMAPAGARQAGETPEAALVVNGAATITQVSAQVVHHGQIVNHQVVVHNWNAPSGPLPLFDAEFLTRVFTSCTELKTYCEMPHDDQTSPNIAPPYVARALVESVREAHRDPVYRNVYLNPKRADQVLICVEDAGTQRWEVRQALVASRDLFDAVVERMKKVVHSSSERPKMPQPIQDAASWVPILYSWEPERYAEEAKSQMAGLFANSRRS